MSTSPHAIGTPCPRCRGSMMRDYDGHGEFLACIQCGHYVDLVGGQVDLSPLPEKKNTPRVRRRMPWA